MTEKSAPYPGGAVIRETMAGPTGSRRASRQPAPSHRGFLAGAGVIPGGIHVSAARDKGDGHVRMGRPARSGPHRVPMP